MVTHAKCPHCGRRLRVKDQYVGHRARCPACFVQFRVTEAHGEMSETCAQAIHGEVEPRLDDVLAPLSTQGFVEARDTAAQPIQEDVEPKLDGAPPPLPSQEFVDAAKQEDQPVRPPHFVRTNVQQGAVIGGWVCFALAVVLMFISLWTVFVFGPLLLASFILSIVAMAQKRILGGVVLLLCTIIVPPIVLVTMLRDTIRDFPPIRAARIAAEKSRERLEASDGVQAPNTTVEDARNQIGTVNIEDARPVIRLGQTITLGEIRVTPKSVDFKRVKSKNAHLDEAETKEPVLALTIAVENISKGQVLRPHSFAKGEDNFGNELEKVKGTWGSALVPEGSTEFDDLHPGKEAIVIVCLSPKNVSATSYDWVVSQQCSNKDQDYRRWELKFDSSEIRGMTTAQQ